MRKQINKEEMRREWIVENWYEKLYYIVGFAIIWIYITAFIIGFVIGVAGTL